MEFWRGFGYACILAGFCLVVLGVGALVYDTLQPAEGAAASPMSAYGIKQPVVDGDLVFIGDQRITDLSSATALTVPDGTRIAWISVDGQNVRYRHGIPTATVGHPLCAGDQLFTAADLDSLQFIEEASGASLFVSYFRY